MTITTLAFYALAIALILAPGAWLLEQALTSLRLPVRGVWIGALALTVGLPLASVVSSPQQRAAGIAGTTQTVVAPAEGAISGSAIPSNGLRVGAPLEPLFGWAAPLNRTLTSGAELLPTGARMDAWISGAWGTASILVALVFLASMVRLRRRVRGWPDETLLGRAVKVSPDLGPATVGPLAPRVIIPRWARGLPPHELEVVLRHEGEHVRSRDTLLLATGLAAVVLFPWNPFIWWQVRRLKDAVEVDCDRRVLRNGVEPAGYGEVLLRLGSRRQLGSLMVPAIFGSTSLLERRLIVMKNMRGRIPIPRVLSATTAALFLILVACATEPPVATRMEASTELAAEANARTASQTQDPEMVAVAIWIDWTGTVRVNDEIHSVERLSEVVASLYTENPVTSVEVHGAAPYGVVSAVLEQLQSAGFVRVVFTMIESETGRSTSSLTRQG